jgi:hypothetical protein
MCEKCRTAMTERSKREQARRAQLLAMHSGGGADSAAAARKKKSASSARKQASSSGGRPQAAGRTSGQGPQTIGYASLESRAPTKAGAASDAHGGAAKKTAAPAQPPAEPAPKKACGCSGPHRPAASFRELVALLRLAEKHLVDLGGYTDPGERLAILRGLYDGTEWSLDFIREKSPVRNLAFRIYTGALAPADPRPFMSCGLAGVLQDSQDTADSTRKLDVGHALIGIDARRVDRPSAADSDPGWLGPRHLHLAGRPRRRGGASRARARLQPADERPHEVRRR